MGILDIRSKDRSPAYYLKIDGLPCLYGTVMPPEHVEALPNGEDLTYQRRAAIIPSRGFNFSRRLQAEDAIIEADTVEVVLVSDDELADDWDPGAVFGRMGVYGADVSAQLLTDIPPSLGAMVIEPSSLDGFQVGDIIHIGREACQVLGVIQEPPGLAIGRAVHGTQQQAHRVDHDTGLYPGITKPAVHWRGRRVTIYESALGPDGEAVGGWIERFKGVIAVEPSVAEDGRSQTVRLDIASMVSLLDTPLGTGRGVLRMADGVHTFDGATCTAFDVVARVAPKGMMNGSFTQTVTLNNGDIVGQTPNEDHWNSVMDTTNSRPKGHPRTPPLYIGSEPEGRFKTIYPDRLDVDSVVLTADVAIDVEEVHYTNHGTAERKRVMIYEGDDPVTIAWPTGLAGLVDTAFAGGLNGVDGCLFDVSLDLFSELAPSFRVETNFEFQTSFGSPMTASILFSNRYDSLIEAGRHEQNHPWSYPHIWNNDGPDRRPIAGKRTFIPYEALALDAPEDVENPGEVQEALLSVNPDTTTAVTHVPTSIASSWYHLGQTPTIQADGLWYFEKYITLNRDPGVIAGQRVALEASKDKEDEPVARVVVDSAEAVVVDGQTVYRCHVVQSESFDEEVFTLADRVGESKYRFKPTVVFSDLTIGELMLQLLCSLDGAGVTSQTYDVLPFGAGIDESDLEVESFLAIPSPVAGEMPLSPVAREGSTIYEVVQGLLLACGYAIDCRTDNLGRHRLAATPMGIPNVAETLDSFTESDIADAPVPSSTSETAIRNIFKFQSNFDEKGDPGVEQSVRDTVSIEAYGEESEMTIEMQGAVLMDDTPGQMIVALRPCFSRLRREFSHPRRIFDITLRAGVASQLRIGGTYSITHSKLRGVKGLGVEGVVCRLRSVDTDGFSSTARCEFVYYGTEGSGWGPSAQITHVNGKILTLSERKHSPPEHPATGIDLEDLTGFLVPGGSVRVHQCGDMDDIQVRTIVAVDLDNNQVELDAGVVLNQPAVSAHIGWLCPDVYPQAPDFHRLFGYLDETKAT